MIRGKRQETVYEKSKPKSLNSTSNKIKAQKVCVIIHTEPMHKLQGTMSVPVKYTYGNGSINRSLFNIV